MSISSSAELSSLLIMCKRIKAEDTVVHKIISLIFIIVQTYFISFYLTHGLSDIEALLLLRELEKSIGRKHAKRNSYLNFV